MRLLPALLALAIVAALFPPRTSRAQSSARDALLVTPQWLSANLRDPQLVVLHVGPKAGYDSAHVPGARYTSLNELGVHDHESPTGLMLQVPPTDSLHAALERLGISDSSRIVVVFGGPYITSATRVIFTLDHVGAGASAALLDGGYGAWTRAGLATTTDVPEVRRGRLSPLRVKPTIVSAEFVRDSATKPGYALVDARASVFYDGVQEGGPEAARKRGHIPGARSVPFNSLGTDNTELLPAAELREKFAAAGVKPGDTVIAYCHIGQQATLVVFAARTLGINARLFDGSFEDWAHRGWPVEVPPASGR